MVNIIKYDNILFFTFYTQAVNQLPPYAGFRLPPFQEHVFSTFCYIYNIYSPNKHGNSGYKIYLPWTIA